MLRSACARLVDNLMLKEDQRVHLLPSGVHIETFAWKSHPEGLVKEWRFQRSAKVPMVTGQCASERYRQ